MFWKQWGALVLFWLMEEMMTEEKRRLEEESKKLVPWKKWGPYLSERQWGDRARGLQRRRECVELLYA